MSRRIATGTAAALLVCGALGALGPVAPLVAPASAATGPDCTSTSAGTLAGTNTPFDQLSMAAAQARVGGAAHAGRGVDVYIVDNLGAPVTDGTPDPHGRIVAGIIGGQPTKVKGDTVETVDVGFAPGADLIPLPAYAKTWTGDSSDDTPNAGHLADVLRGIAGQIHNRRAVVLVPYVVGPARGLPQAVAALAKKALVVAPIGDQPTDAGEPGVGPLYPTQAPGQSSDDASMPPGQDAAGLIWPAAGQGVLAVGVADWSYGPTTTPAGPLPDSDVDVAAPVGGGISYGAGKGPCVIATISTDWAAAEVAGVAALTWSARPGLTVAELRERLELTADGGGTSQGNTMGYGVVQPLAAITEPLGALHASGPRVQAARRATAPEQPADVLARTRHSAVWWGLFGGGALVVALLLRPLLSRRRG